MNQIRVARVTEPDFDQMIAVAGGRRCVQDSSVQNNPNADYELDDAFLELKLVEEEGLENEKDSRRNKVAALFRAIQPGRPVVVLDPTQLDAEGERRYFNIMAGPIQNAVKHAARQLESTRAKAGDNRVRVLVAINNGYTSLSHEEFKRLVLKSARYDTKKIDSVVVGGIYHYSDQYDSNVLFPLEECPIDISRRFHAFAKLKEQWDAFSERVMASLIRGDDPSRSFEKMPVVDIAFDIDSVSYVKPAPKIGIPSEFWKQGRPRYNSTGMTTYPPVARTFPDMNAENWRCFREALPSSTFFLKSYADWVHFREEELVRNCEPRMPLVPVVISYKGAFEWCRQLGHPLGEAQVFAYAADLFDQAAHDLIARAVSRSATSILPARYIWVETHEIGQDRAYDFSSIRLVRETHEGTDVLELIKSERIFHKHALALAAAYALKYKVDVVMYDRVLTYAWI